jgi:hypothetical protein
METADVAAIAALVVAVVALITALAQALQQYFITGQLIRMCDSVVFGPLPGQGRRIWQFSQFRFRVLYSIPQISLRADLWPSNGSYHVQSYAVGRHPLPHLAGDDGPGPAAMTTATASDGKSEEWVLRRRRRPDFQEADNNFVGEASWASFCRAIEVPCGASVRLDHVQYDADRCPADLVSAPMQVSMRDIIVMALMSGMEITSASFDEKSVSMQGAAGTLTSSKHAVLGTILHFTPRITYERHVFAFGFHMTAERGFISSFWLARTWGVCCVARRYFNWSLRRTTRRLDDRWIRDQDDAAPRFFMDESEEEEHISSRRKTKRWARGIVPTEPTEKSKRKKRGFTRGDDQGKEVIRIPRAIPDPRPQDGEWDITVPRRLPVIVISSGKGRDPNGLGPGKHRHAPPTAKVTKPRTEAVVQEDIQFPKPSRRATVEDASDHGGESHDNHYTVIREDENSRQTSTDTKTGAPYEGLSNSPLPHAKVVTVDRTSIDSSGGAGEAGADDYEQESTYSNLEDDAELLERVQQARALQAARAERLAQIQRDKDLVEDSMKRGAITSPYDEAVGHKTPLLLTYYPANGDNSAGDTQEERGKDDDKEEQDNDQPTKEEEDARQRELERAREREARERERDERNKARNRATTLHYVDIYWFSQMDVMRGYWATSWHNPDRTPIYSSLTGCVTVVLEALLGFMGSEYIVYTGGDFDVSYSFRETAVWMCEPYSIPDWKGGHAERRESSYNHTYPAYAHNARGGVIARGQYTGCRIASFPGRVIPVLELAHSYDWQVDSSSRKQTFIEEQNVELMRLDSWLSYVGRLDEISDGPHQLLRQTPALLHLLMQEFQIDFQNIDLSAKEGGLQDIQGLAANLMDFLTDEELTEAEQLYVLVALLRTAKVGQCVLGGSDTEPLDDILRLDVQAHLV